MLSPKLKIYLGIVAALLLVFGTPKPTEAISAACLKISRLIVQNVSCEQQLLTPACPNTNDNDYYYLEYDSMADCQQDLPKVTQAGWCAQIYPSGKSYCYSQYFQNEKNKCVPSANYVLKDFKSLPACWAQASDNPQVQKFSSVLKELQARPSFIPEITLPGLNLSKILVSQTDESGATYVSIPWIAQYLTWAYRFLMGVGSILAVVMIIIEGAKIVVSGGGEQKITAYKRIGQIVIGLMILWGSYAIMYNLNPDLVNFKALRVQAVPGIPLETEAKSDDDSQSAPSPVGAPSPICANPNLKITNLDAVDPSLSPEYKLFKNLLTPQRINAYKEAVKASGKNNVPWEIVAAIHYKEAGMQMSGDKSSIFNGEEPCNTINDGDLLNWCNTCADKSPQNDLICGVKKISDKAGGGTLGPDDVNLVKSTFCKYNGCFTCADGHPYVATFFDKDHAVISKQVHDCVPASCNPNTTSDYSVNPPQKNKGCNITVFASRSHPNIGLTNYCLANQVPSCGEESGDKITYHYNNKPVSAGNPCGSWKMQSRVGALGLYAYLLKLEKDGIIQK